MTVLRMYTDGGCRGNQNDENAGGWGTILEFGEPDTTNNRMELTAVIEGFRALKRDGQTVEVFSDSAYVANCFREKWYEAWEKNHWRNAARKAVDNQDLWKELLALVRLHEVEFFRVKGHVNPNGKSTDMNALYEKFLQWNGAGFSFEDFEHVTEMNNRADRLANNGIDEVKEQAAGEQVAGE